jgi:hypothetical protein
MTKTQTDRLMVQGRVGLAVPVWPRKIFTCFADIVAFILLALFNYAYGLTIGVLGFDSRRGPGIFLFTTAPRTALGPTQPPIQWVPGTISLGVKRPGREADHSPLSSAEVKNASSCTSTPQYVLVAWCLVKHRDNFIFTFLNCVGYIGSIRDMIMNGVLLNPRKPFDKLCRSQV